MPRNCSTGRFSVGAKFAMTPIWNSSAEVDPYAGAKTRTFCETTALVFGDVPIL
jgi:hypothetical protein